MALTGQRRDVMLTHALSYKGSKSNLYLALSPGSVLLEQHFSTAGLILNGKRSQLSPFRINVGP